MSQNFEAFVAPARARNAPWRVAAGTFLTLGVAFLALVGIMQGMIARYPDMLRGMATGNDGRTIMTFLANFIGLHLGLVFALAILHGRSYLTLFGPPGSGLGRTFRWGIVVAVGLAMVQLVLWPINAALFPELREIDPVIRPILPWLGAAVIALPFILIQSSAEELFFRGYLLQQLGSRWSHPLVWAGLPALVFGLFHFNDTGLGLTTYFHMGSTVVAGYLLALVTARTGSIGAAIGLHFANNVIALLWSAVAGFMDGLALMRFDIDLEGGYLAYGLVLQTLIYILAYQVWARWHDRRAALPRADGAHN